MRRLELNKEKIFFLDKSEVEKVKYSLKLSGTERILVASTLCEEGKTTIALNICKSLVEDGEKILYIGKKSELIDADMEGGEEIFHSEIENFDLMVTRDLKEAGSREYQDYDRVLIEAPALEESKDGIFLADHSETVLLIVETNCVGYSKLREARALLTEGRCKDIRVVLNKVKKNYGVLKRKKVRRD